MIVLITYDLNKPGKDYSDLYNAIKAISKDYLHQLESVWITDTDFSVQQIAARLRNHIDQNDELLVQRVMKDYDGLLPHDSWNWLNQRVSF